LITKDSINTDTLKATIESESAAASKPVTVTAVTVGEPETVETYGGTAPTDAAHRLAGSLLASCLAVAIGA